MSKKHKKGQQDKAPFKVGDNNIKRPGSIEMKALEQPRKHAADNIPDKLICGPNSFPGIYFGISHQLQGNCYVGMSQGTDGNIIVIGGNGSGKSSGIAKPTLLTWQGALCVTDIKGELSQTYKGLYEGGNVMRPPIIFDPADEESPSYDPFGLLIQDGEHNLVRNIREIAAAIIPVPPDDKQPFWAETEQDLFAAALLYYFNLGLSFSEAVCKIMAMTTSSLCRELSETSDSRIKMILGEAANLKGDMLASIDRGLRNKLILFATDPYISHALRGKREEANCFTWEDLDAYNIFLRIPADRIEQWGGAINLMYTQLIRCLERRPEQYSLKGRSNIQTLLLMDEFARFGKLEMITSAMATLRSKNVNICLMIQSIAQLDKIYGEYDRRIIFDNCQFQAILRANDADTQKYLCELIGTCIRRYHSIGDQLDQSMNPGGYSRQITEVREPQIFPHELSTLDEILLLTPYGFCQVDKLRPGSSAANHLMYPVYNPGLTVSKDSPQLCSTLDDPIILCDYMANEGAEILSIEERAHNAAKRADNANYQERVELRQAVQDQQKRAKRRNYIIGEIITDYFPELAELEPGAQRKEDPIFGPLKAFLIELASNQELVEQLKERASYWDMETGSCSPPDCNV